MIEIFASVTQDISCLLITSYAEGDGAMEVRKPPSLLNYYKDATKDVEKHLMD
jgi:hypothetical protein